MAQRLGTPASAGTATPRRSAGRTVTRGRAQRLGAVSAPPQPPAGCGALRPPRDWRGPVPWCKMYPAFRKPMAASANPSGVHDLFQRRTSPSVTTASTAHLSGRNGAAVRSSNRRERSFSRWRLPWTRPIDRTSRGISWSPSASSAATRPDLPLQSGFDRLLSGRASTGHPINSPSARGWGSATEGGVRRGDSGDGYPRGQPSHQQPQSRDLNCFPPARPSVRIRTKGSAVYRVWLRIERYSWHSAMWRWEEGTPPMAIS